MIGFLLLPILISLFGPLNNFIQYINVFSKSLILLLQYPYFELLKYKINLFHPDRISESIEKVGECEAVTAFYTPA